MVNRQGYNVYQDGKDWRVEKFGSDRASGVFETQTKALEFANEQAGKHGGQVVLQKRGRFAKQ